MRNINWVEQSVTTTGTSGTLSIGAATSGHSTLSQRLVVGALFPYTLLDGANKESGVATLTSATVVTKHTIWEKIEAGVVV